MTNEKDISTEETTSDIEIDAEIFENNEEAEESFLPEVEGEIEEEGV